MVADHDVELDRNGLEVLRREECLELLGSATVGRIGLSAGALPLVLPVNFCVDGERIVLRTGAGTTLGAASHHAVVSFEADDIDPLFHTGWSVVVTGVARHLTSEGDLRRARGLPLLPWTGPGECFVAISLDVVSGRRILRPEQAPRTPVAPG